MFDNAFLAGNHWSESLYFRMLCLYTNMILYSLWLTGSLKLVVNVMSD